MISLTPKNMQFFDLLEECGQKLGQVAESLAAASQGKISAESNAATVIIHRDACDVLFERYVEELHAAFVTPIDRDDLYNLGFDLDRVVEAMERLANRWVTYD